MTDHIQEQIDTYLNHQNTRALARGTVKLYTSVFKNKLVPFCRHHTVEKLDADFIDLMDQYAQFLIDSGLSARSTASYLTISKIVFRFHGVDLKHTFRIPREDQQANDIKHQRRWFSDEDIARCKTYRFRVNHTRNHLFLRLLLDTGARVDELAHITVGNVKLERKMIELDYSKTIARWVFFDPETGVYLQKYLQDAFPDPVASADRLIFPSKNMLYKIIVEMLSDLGLKKQCDGRGPHTFRHYVATNLVYVRKKDVAHVAKLLGDTPDTITNNYLHPTAEMLQAIMMDRAA